jgi:rubrerythrin
VGDPATGEPIGKTEKNLKAAVADETYEYTQMYPGMAKKGTGQKPKHPIEVLAPAYGLEE